MSQDPNKKVTKNFQCREALWQKFEQMSKELECSVDYLINDAMKQYARQRGYGAATTGGGPSMPPSGAPAPAPTAAPPPPPPAGAGRVGGGPRPMPPPKRGAAPMPPPPPPIPGRRIGTPPPLAPSRSVPPAKPGPSAHPAGMNLTIHYQGEAF